VSSGSSAAAIVDPQEAALHYQKSEYPLDYTKTASASTARPHDHGADSLADRLGKATDGTQEAADRVAERVRELTEKSQEAFDSLVPSIERR
jgi:hypothetical protein